MRVELIIMIIIIIIIIIITSPQVRQKELRKKCWCYRNKDERKILRIFDTSKIIRKWWYKKRKTEETKYACAHLASFLAKQNEWDNKWKQFDLLEEVGNKSLPVMPWCG